MTMKKRVTYENGRYSFSIYDNEYDITVSSSNHSGFIPFIARDYEYAWEACRDMNKVGRNKHYFESAKYAQETMEALDDAPIIDVSAEQMLENRYIVLLSSMEERARGAEGDAEEEKAVFDEIKMIETEMMSVIQNSEDEDLKRKVGSIVKGMAKIKRRYLPLHTERDDNEKTASKSTKAKDEAVEEYAQKASQAIQKICESVVYHIKDYALYSVIILTDMKNDEPILTIRVNERLHIDDIMPAASTAKIYPFYSSYFYQKFWKPIVESVGHFCVDDAKFIITICGHVLPDIPSDEDVCFFIPGYNFKDNKKGYIGLSFRGKDQIWLFEKFSANKFAANQTKKVYSEQGLLNSIVKCIDNGLESILGRTGEVIQVIPQADFNEVDVDFGRGINVIRLSEKQIEVVQV